MRLSNWFSRKWEMGGRGPYPDLTALWRKMNLNEAWEPSFPLDTSWSLRNPQGEAKGAGRILYTYPTLVPLAPPTSPPSPPHRPNSQGEGQHQVVGGGDIPHAMAYHPRYNNTRCIALMYKGGLVSYVLKSTPGLGLNLTPPPCDKSK